MLNQEEVKKRLSELSPERQKALNNLLRKKGIADSKLPIIACREASIPLSSNQLSLWYGQQLEPDSPVYNLPLAIRLKGPLKVDHLEKSLGKIVLRHEALRTSFPSVNGEPVQVISSDTRVNLPIIDIRDIAVSKQEGEIQRLAKQEVEQPFDLAEGLLWRFKLLHLAESEYILLVTIHHIIFDGKSSNIFLQELQAFYQALANNQPLSLPKLTIQYADFACWEQQWLKSKELESQLNYWQKKLEGDIPVLDLPIVQSRPTVNTYRGSRQSLELPKNLVDDLKMLSSNEGATLFMTLLAGFKTLLHCYSQQTDILLCSPVKGHSRIEIEPLIGYFNNIALMRTDLSENPSFRQLIARVKQTALEAYNNQTTPLQKIAQFPNLAGKPLIRYSFALRHARKQPLELPELNVSFLDIHNGTSNFDLSLLLIEQEGTMTAVLEYKTSLFEEASIKQMLEYFQTLLVSLVANPNQQLSSLHLLKKLESDRSIKTIEQPVNNKQQSQPSLLPPRDKLETKLTEIWSQVLNVKPIGVQDNFFELGGNSLQAVNLFAHIEQQFGKKLPLATLFQSGTVAQIAEIIRQEKWLAPWASLVPIQPQGNKPPLFYIHGGGGNLLVYRDLAFSLGLDQPVYGLQPRGLDGRYAPFNRIEDMAAYYLAQIRKLQPNGPYFLAGLSSGGTTAWEIAQILQAQGEKAALLALFDSHRPNCFKLLSPVPRLLSVFKSVVSSLLSRAILLPPKIESKLKQSGTKQTSRKVLESLKVVKQVLNEDQKINQEKMQRNFALRLAKYQSALSKISVGERWINSLAIWLLKHFARGYYTNAFVAGLAGNYMDTIDDISNIPEELQQVQKANIEANRDYDPSVYPGRVTLFRASERPPGFYFDPLLGWGDLAAEGIEVYEITGNHTSIMKSSVLAQQLKICLDNAQAASSIADSQPIY